MRGRMRDARSYAQPVEIGGVMVGGTVSEVVESRYPDFKAGDFVLGYGGWQTHHVGAATPRRVSRPRPTVPLVRAPRVHNSSNRRPVRLAALMHSVSAAGEEE